MGIIDDGRRREREIMIQMNHFSYKWKVETGLSLRIEEKIKQNKNGENREQRTQNSNSMRKFINTSMNDSSHELMSSSQQI